MQRFNQPARLLSLVIGLFAAAGFQPLHAQQASCPSHEPRLLTCADAIKVMSYDPALDLQQSCDQLAKANLAQIRNDKRNAYYRLPDGTKAMYQDASGWLILPRDKGLKDLPDTLALWWRNRDCDATPALSRSFGILQ
jgi:hypothetical protein